MIAAPKPDKRNVMLAQEVTNGEPGDVHAVDSYTLDKLRTFDNPGEARLSATVEGWNITHEFSLPSRNTEPTERSPG